MKNSKDYVIPQSKICGISVAKVLCASDEKTSETGNTKIDSWVVHTW